jgi:DNA-binding response OmpR family regulator
MTRAPARILVIEDASDIRMMIRLAVGREQYELTEADDGRSGLVAARDAVPDVILLDLGLPDMDGADVCRELRSFCPAYIIILSGRDNAADSFVDSTERADDYIMKPFSPLRLVAEIRAALRRIDATRAPEAEVVHRLGDLVVDEERRAVTVAGRSIQLRPDEFDVLKALLRDPSAVLSHEQLLDAVWGHGRGADDRLVDDCVAQLSAKLGDASEEPRIITKVRDGYGIDAALMSAVTTNGS